MKELIEWLHRQGGGVHTYYEFQGKALSICEDDPENAALARLLAGLAGRFADCYDGQPLPATIANEALARLIAYGEKAVRLSNGSPAERLALLNEIGREGLN